MLENILIKYFGLEEDWNDDEEKGIDKWNSAYSKLTSLIYDLGDLGVFLNSTWSSIIVDELDKIESEDE